MKQSGNTINNRSLQEFLDSAQNAAEYGQRQFFTPPNLAAALCRPLAAGHKQLVADFHFGSGAIAHASAARHALGLDIDIRSEGLHAPEGSEWHVHQADLTHWYPLASEVGFTAPFILINPPFSLRWYSDRLAPLRRSTLPEVAAAAAAHPKHIDSTLASFLIALDLLAADGEGFMICNAATARRFFGDPTEFDSTAPHAALRKYLWLWLDIPGAKFEGLTSDTDFAVLYFSRSHGRYEDGNLLHLVSPAAHPDAVTMTLCEDRVFQAHTGSRMRYASDTASKSTLDRWEIVNREYRQRHHQAKPDWNIRLDAKGCIRTYLTPFQSVSRQLPRDLVTRLQALDGQTPIQLCVTATSRTALREAMQCRVWTIHPDVQTAIEAALVDFDKDGAPFYRPGTTQALGWIDEMGELECAKDGIGACQPGDRCPIQSSIEKTTWTGDRINLAGEKENLNYHGEELLVTLTDPSGVKHHFHVRRDEELHGDEIDEKTGKVTARHWPLATLLEHFHIPVPKDITTLRPGDYQANLDHLARIEAMVNANLAAADAA